MIGAGVAVTADQCVPCTANPAGQQARKQIARAMSCVEDVADLFAPLRQFKLRLPPLRLSPEQLGTMVSSGTSTVIHWSSD